MTRPRAEWACEALKALRSGWLCPRDFAEEMGISDVNFCRAELQKMAEYGLAISRKRSRDKHGKATGTPPEEYTLSPHWRNDVGAKLTARRVDAKERDALRKALLDLVQIYVVDGAAMTRAQDIGHAWTAARRALGML
jgi:hypothetical protein